MILFGTAFMQLVRQFGIDRHNVICQYDRRAHQLLENPSMFKTFFSETLPKMEQDLGEFVRQSTAEGLTVYQNASFRKQITFDLDIPPPICQWNRPNLDKWPAIGSGYSMLERQHIVNRNIFDDLSRNQKAWVLWWSNAESVRLYIDIGRGRAADPVSVLSVRLTHHHYDYEALVDIFEQGHGVGSVLATGCKINDPYYLDIAKDVYVHGEEIIYTSSDLSSIIFNKFMGGHAELLRDLFGLHGLLDEGAVVPEHPDPDYDENDARFKNMVLGKVEIDAFIRVRRPVDYEDVKVNDLLSPTYALPSEVTSGAINNE